MYAATDPQTTSVAAGFFRSRPLRIGWVCSVSWCIPSVWCLPQATGQTPQNAPAETEELPQINPDGLTPSATCGKCHQAIHAVWRESLHAEAWSNHIFQAAYKRASESNGSEGARLCLQCHAPTVRHTKDYAVKEPITAEGITCDFCHSVKNVDLADENDPIRMDVGRTKYGPLRHAQSPAHQIVDTQLHTRAEFCASCHEYKNAHGVTVLGTYGEWKKSSYAKRGTQCQDCHMPLVPGRVVALNVKGQPESVNLHKISGSHNIDKVRDAIKLELVGYDWITDNVQVYVQVTNEGSGHCFPTGLPMHSAVLEVAIHDHESEIDRRRIRFGLTLVDDEGRPIAREHEVFLNAARVRNDTRIKPNEARTVDVRFSDVKAKRLMITADLYYEYATEALVEEDGVQRIEPVKMRFLIASGQARMKPLGR